MKYVTRNEILDVNKTTEAIIGAAIEVHRLLGPGLLESTYEECLSEELLLRKIPFKRQIGLPVVYKTKKLDIGYRIDLLVNDEVVVELKTVESILPTGLQTQRIRTLRSPRLCGGNKEKIWRQRFWFPCSGKVLKKSR